MITQISATVRVRDGRLERLVSGKWVVVFTPPVRTLPRGVVQVGRA